MAFRQTFFAAVLMLSVAPAVLAQSAQTPSAPTAVATSGTAVDVDRLPIDMRRLKREFRQASERGDQNGLNLRYFVEVYGQAPPLVFFTPQDNLRYGPVPHGAPTHRDMLWMLTPQEHRGSLYALPLFRLPIGGSKKVN